MAYEVFRRIDGKVGCIIKDGNMCIPMTSDNVDYQQFLLWQAEQEVPLDLSDGPSAEDLRIEALSLEAYKLERAAVLSAEVRDFIYSKYEPHRQMSLTNLKMGALPNRLAYLNQVWVWIQQCMGLYYSKEDLIAAALDKTEVATISISPLELASLEVLDPLVTIRQAISILD